MDASLYLARSWGLLLTVLAGTFLANPRALRRWVSALKELTFVYATAYIAIIIGVATVAANNRWVADWPIVLTLIGWASVAKGVSRLVSPEHAFALEAQLERRRGMIALAYGGMLTLGLFLTYQGFFAN